MMNDCREVARVPFVINHFASYKGGMLHEYMNVAHMVNPLFNEELVLCSEVTELLFEGLEKSETFDAVLTLDPHPEGYQLCRASRGWQVIDDEGGLHELYGEVSEEIELYVVAGEKLYVHLEQ